MTQQSDSMLNVAYSGARLWAPGCTGSFGKPRFRPGPNVSLDTVETRANVAGWVSIEWNGCKARLQVQHHRTSCRLIFPVTGLEQKVYLMIGTGMRLWIYFSTKSKKSPNQPCDNVWPNKKNTSTSKLQLIWHELDNLHHGVADRSIPRLTRKNNDSTVIVSWQHAWLSILSAN